MRFTTTIILLFLFTFSTISQNSSYLVKADAVWSTVEIHCLPNGNLYSSHHIKFEGDSLFENNAYKKVYRCNDEAQLDWFYYGLIREDELQQVFFKPPGYPAGMIYNFGVSVNDSIEAVNTYLNAYDTLHFVVTAIDSIEMLDGFKKQITLHEYMNNKEEIWIEGLGSYYGVLNSCNNAYGGVCGGYEALCYEEAGNLIYQNSLYQTCHYAALVGINEIGLEDLQVYPNPASEIIYIDINSDIRTNPNLIFELFSLDGKKIVEKKLVKNKNAVYLPAVNKGLYIIKLEQRDSGYNLPLIKILVD